MIPAHHKCFLDCSCVVCDIYCFKLACGLAVPQSQLQACIVTFLAGRCQNVIKRECRSFFQTEYGSICFRLACYTGCVQQGRLGPCTVMLFADGTMPGFVALHAFVPLLVMYAPHKLK